MVLSLHVPSCAVAHESECVVPRVRVLLFTTAAVVARVGGAGLVLGAKRTELIVVAFFFAIFFVKVSMTCLETSSKLNKKSVVPQGGMLVAVSVRRRPV